MQLFGIRTKLIKKGDDLVIIILEAVENQKFKIEEGDVLAIASKIVAITQKRLKRLGLIKPSNEAKKLAKRYGLEPGYAEIVLHEAEKVYGGVSKALLTQKEYILTANAGVDHKNAPNGHVVLWPKAPFKTAKKIRREILVRTGKHVGVLIVDSRVTPLRMGTTGLALGVAGIEPVRDCRTDKDLYGNAISITRHAVADDLASAAHLIMGESNEQTPVVLIKKAPVMPTDELKPSSVVISPKRCLFAKHIVQNPVKECL